MASANQGAKLLCKLNSQPWRPVLTVRQIAVSINIDGRFMAVRDSRKLPTDIKSTWKLCASVCLMRPPVQEPLLNDVESRYALLADAKELAKSCLSDWEAEKIRQNMIVKLAEASGDKKKVKIDFRQTFQDIEDENELELESFTNSRNEIVPDDSNLRDIMRHPRETLLLIMKQTLGKDTVWMLPTSEWQGEKTLKKTADEALATCFGGASSVLFLSNAPSGFYKYKFPKEARSDQYSGAKLFLFNAYLPRNVQGSVVPQITLTPNEEKVLDYAWITRSEMAKYLKPKYSKAIQDCLL